MLIGFNMFLYVLGLVVLVLVLVLLVLVLVVRTPGTLLTREN